MTRSRRFLVSCVLAALLAGCDKAPPVFEDVGRDPHPPRLTLLGIGIQLPAPDPDSPLPPVDFVPPEAGITIRPFDDSGKTLALRFAYADAAADIDSITTHDLDGNMNFTGSFADIFLGTSGVAQVNGDVEATVAGPHRVEVWLKDLNGSRSEKTVFIVTIVF